MAETDPVIKRGQLAKKGMGKKGMGSFMRPWADREVVVDENKMLSYYDENKVQKGQIALAGASVRTLAADQADNRSCAFEIFNIQEVKAGKENSLVLAASTESDRDGWIKCLLRLGLKKEVVAVKDPVVADEPTGAPVEKEKEVTDKKKDPSSKKETPASVKKETSDPVKKETAPVKKETAPVKKETAPVKKEQSASTPVEKEKEKEKEVNDKSKISSSKKESLLPVKETPVPVNSDTPAPVKKDTFTFFSKKEKETPEKKETPVPVEKEESPEVKNNQSLSDLPTGLTSEKVSTSPRKKRASVVNTAAWNTQVEEDQNSTPVVSKQVGQIVKCPSGIIYEGLTVKKKRLNSRMPYHERALCLHYPTARLCWSPQSELRRHIDPYENDPCLDGTGLGKHITVDSILLCQCRDDPELLEDGAQVNSKKPMKNTLEILYDTKADPEALDKFKGGYDRLTGTYASFYNKLEAESASPKMPSNWRQQVAHARYNSHGFVLKFSSPAVAEEVLKSIHHLMALKHGFDV